jgi:SAM-dependent methyltransferase
VAVQAWHDRWLTLDDTDDPDFFVRFLDLTRAPLLAAARTAPEQVFADLGLASGMVVLDVGCGTGDVTRAFAPLVGANGHVRGLDFSQHMIETAKQRIEGLGLPISFEQGEAQALPYPDASFDRVHCAQLLQHLPDPERAIAEFVRVVKPGGKVIAKENDYQLMSLGAIPHDASRVIFDQIWSDLPHPQIGPDAPGLFQAAGLTGVEVTAAPIILRQLQMIGDWLLPSLARAVEAGRIDAAEADDVRQQLQSVDAAGSFVFILVGLTITGMKL